MISTSRFLIVFSVLGILLFPTVTFAAVGLQPGFEVQYDYDEPEPEPEPEVELSTGALLEAEQKQALWTERKARTLGFWGRMMNNRKNVKNFRENHKERKEKRVEKRIACREVVRRSNRDTVNETTLHCFRAVLSLDLEMLRKEKQYVESIAGPRDEYRSAAIFHIENLMDAIATIIQAIDVGVYTDKESVQDAKKNLGEAYRNQHRLAMTRLRIDRSATWMTHLMVRLNIVLTKANPPAQVIVKITESITCLESKEAALEELLPMEDNQALVAAFRQVQSEVKICTDAARDAYLLNTEVEQ